MSYRPVQPADWLLLREVIEKGSAKARASGMVWASHVDTATVLNHVLGNPNAFIAGESYLVVLTDGKPWHSQVNVLEEELVQVLVPGGDFSEVVNCLKSEAIKRGCAYIAVGTALSRSDRALSRLYGRAGFRQEAATLVLSV